MKENELETFQANAANYHTKGAHYALALIMLPTLAGVQS